MTCEIGTPHLELATQQPQNPSPIISTHSRHLYRDLGKAPGTVDHIASVDFGNPSLARGTGTTPLQPEPFVGPRATLTG